MLTITNKTKRADLVTEIETLRTRARLDAEVREHLERTIREREEQNANLAHKVEVLETDVHNLLGAIRVFADSARTVRVRRKSVQDADLAIALPFRNTDKI